MANLIRKRETEPSITMGGFDPLRTMRELLRWDPFGRDMSRLLEPLADIEPGPRQGEAVFLPNVEVKETQDAFVLKADLPGVNDEDVDVSISGNRVTITGRREEENRNEGDRFYSYERSYGVFSRSFMLPEGVDMDGVKAELDQGVLSLTVPKKEASQARRIAVSGKGEKKGELPSGAQETTSAEEQRTSIKEREQAGQKAA